MFVRLALTALIVLTCGLNAVAEVPQIISYQGRLTDATGQPVADDTYEIEFLLYGSEAGADLLWSSGDVKVDVAGGVFEYNLGSNTPFGKGLFTSAGERYLTLVVGAEPEATPRIRIVANAYALQAVNADTAVVAVVAKDVQCTQCVGNSQLDDGAVTPSKLATDAVTAGKIADDAVTGANVIDGTLSALDLADNPGVAAVYESSCDLYDDSVAVIDSIGISVPAPGYIMIFANACLEMRPNSTTLKMGNARFLVYDRVPVSLPGLDAVVGYSNMAQASSAFQWHNVSFSKVNTVATPGDYWYYFLGDQGFDSGSVEVRWARLNAVYIPTFCGAAMSPAGDQAGQETSYIDETTPDRKVMTEQAEEVHQLEVDALRKRQEAERAENALLKARLEAGEE